MACDIASSAAAMQWHGRWCGAPDIAGNRMDFHSLDQGWHTQFLTKFQKLNGFRELVAMRVCPRQCAYACTSGNGPTGIGPKLACARPLSRRKTSPNGHKTLSADSSRHALQLSAYKRPLKRPLTRPNRPCKNTHFPLCGPSSPPETPI